MVQTLKFRFRYHLKVFIFKIIYEEIIIKISRATISDYIWLLVLVVLLSLNGNQTSRFL